MLQKTCPVHRRVVKWFSPFVMPRRRRGAAASAEDSFTYEMIRLGNSFRDGRRRKCTNLTEDDFWPRLCNLEGRVWTRASEMRERERERERRAPWYIITIFVMLWRGIRFPLRDWEELKKEEEAEVDRKRDAKFATFRPPMRACVTQSTCYVRGWPI